MASERTALVVPTVAALLIHGAVIAGLDAAEHFVGKRPTFDPMQVTIEVKPVEPPPPPPPQDVEAKPPEPPPQETKPPPRPQRKAAPVAKPSPTPKAPEEPPPAPGPPDEAPAPQKIYTLEGGGIIVHPGAAGGSTTGVPGGTGKGKGGGGLAGSTGTSGPQPVALASVKRQPQAIGDYDYNKDYPEEARKLGIEGQVAVRLLVDENGQVAETKLSRGLGHGLDQKALELTRRIRFKPAIDDGDHAVAVWITWIVTFTLPR